MGYRTRERIQRCRRKPALMATQNPMIQDGSYVQLNPSSDSPRAAAPSSIEQTIGVVRGSYTQAGEPYYQVVWNPGSDRPKVATYHASELTVLSQQQAQQIMQQISAGTYQPNTQQQGSTYQPRPLPSQVSPQTQNPGQYTPLT